jgi:hypothetical protein
LHCNGRDEKIRTSGPLTPSQVRYQTALHPVNLNESGIILYLQQAVKNKPVQNPSYLDVQSHAQTVCGQPSIWNRTS